MNSALEMLYARRRFGIKPGLDVETAILEALGNPEKGLKVIHVAGTNGKGSICAVLASILHASGLKTGLFTSPHLVNFNERFQVDGVAIDDKTLFELVFEIEKHATKVSKEMGKDPTFFECSTAIAFEYFRRQNVDVVVLETGMGGRLDATNVVIPLLSVISRVSLEHTVQLGPDLASIAREKGGIIKRSVPVVCAEMEASVREVLLKIADERGCDLIDAARETKVSVISRGVDGQRVSVVFRRGCVQELFLPLVGDYQCENLGVALTACEMLQKSSDFRFTPEIYYQGVKSVHWPARFHVVSRDPWVILDGAHNPGAAKALATTLRTVVTGPLGLVMGLCDDKDCEAFLRPFDGAVERLWAVPLPNERSAPLSRISRGAAALGWDVSEESIESAMQKARKWAKQKKGVVLVTGSLFLAGEVLGRKL